MYTEKKRKTGCTRIAKRAVQGDAPTFSTKHDAEVFGEMESGEHDAATETLYFNFTRR
jgi:hypothetical protein